MSLMYRKVCNQYDQEMLQQDLHRLYRDWENTWQMSFNPSKRNTTQFSPSKRKGALPTTYHFYHGQQLVVTSSSKYLGTTITDDLSWTDHAKTVAAKGNRTVGFLRRNFRDCTTKVRSATYVTMGLWSTSLWYTGVRHYGTLEYASTVWDPHKQKDT